MKRTVFFGPFIGEFGWELMSWQGWVRKVCSDKFSDHWKIASSYEGRSGLYPDIDEFWPIPKSFEKHITNSVHYLIKGWRNGLPGSKEVRFIPEKRFRDGRVYLDYRQEEVYEAGKGPDVEPLANALLDNFKKQLPPDTKFIMPWKYNKFEDDNLEFGLLPQDYSLVNIEHLKSWSWPSLPKESRLLVREIPPQHQTISKLHATHTGRKLLNDLVGTKTDLISVFPRYRRHYATRNWPKEKYEQLIILLQSKFPKCKVAIVGEPGGSYFDDGVPFNTLDLITIDPTNRVSVQIAAMERSLFALGSSSGGLYLPYYTDCPVFKWSNPGDIEGDMDSQILATPEYIYPKTQPEVAEVFKEVLEFWRSITIAH